MFQVDVRGFLHEDRGVIGSGENLIDRKFVRNGALRESQTVPSRLKNP